MEYKECKSKYHEGEKIIPVDQFSKHAKTKDGLQSYCKACMSVAQRRWYTTEKQQRNTDRWWSKKQADILSETGMIFSTPTSYSNQKQKTETPEKYLLKRAKSNAKKTGVEFDITVEDIIVPKECPVLRIPLFFTDNAVTDNTPSVDRIDSSKGYIKGNVVIISWRANRIKNDGTPDEHQRIYEFFNFATDKYTTT